MATSRPIVQPIDASFSLKDKAYESLKRAITTMNLYAEAVEPRLDERQLADELGVSRTPLREAIARLEQEGFVRTVARKGVFVVRKSKREILEMITVWAALESMAARLVTKLATTREIDSLRRLFGDFQGGEVEARIDEYSERNIAFHQTILDLSRCELLRTTADGLFLHMRGIRVQTIGEEDRAARSIIDHMSIIEVIERRETELAEKLVREHALKLAEHVERHVDYLN